MAVGLVIAGLSYLGASSPSIPIPHFATQTASIRSDSASVPIHDQSISKSRETVPEQSIPSAADLDAELRRSENSHFASRLKRLVENAFELSNQNAEKSKFIEELATNDTGRKIAADAVLTASIIALLEIPDNRFQEILAIVERASDLQKLFDEAIKKLPTMGVSKEAPKQAEELEKLISEKRKQLQDFQSAINRIAIESSGRSLSTKTLGAAMDDHKSRQSASLAAAIRAEREATQKAKEELARENEIKMKELELQADRVKAEGDRRLKEAEIIAAEIAATKASEDRLLQAEYDRDREQIKHYLHPLFVPGETQPSTNGWIRTLDSKPVSLNGLKSSGALHSLPLGPIELLLLFNDSGNDRKVRGPYPGFNGGGLQEVHAEAIMPAYKLLVKYQHILVKEKLLSP